MPLGPGGWHGPPPREVCIVMLSAIGDAVHVLPVVTALKRAWPECRITWVIQPGPHALVAGHPAVDEFVIFHRRTGARAWAGFHDVARRLQGRRFDLLMGLQVYLKAGLLTSLISADVKLGFDRARARDAQWAFTNARVPVHEPQHVQDQYFEFLDHLGVEPEPVTWDLALSETERHAQHAFFSALDRPACAVVVGTSKRRKNWLPERYARVLEALEERHGLQPILVGGPSPAEGRIARDIESLTAAHPLNELGRDLRRLVWILQGSALTISPDTGPLHISRALGTPVVGLYGCTDPLRSGPYRAFGDLVVDGYAADPGRRAARGRDGGEGMHRITVDQVMARVALALTAYPRAAQPRRVIATGGSDPHPGAPVHHVGGSGQPEAGGEVREHEDRAE